MKNLIPNYSNRFKVMIKPFKNLKTVEKSSKYMHLKQIAQMTLGSGNMSLAV